MKRMSATERTNIAKLSNLIFNKILRNLRLWQSSSILVILCMKEVFLVDKPVLESGLKAVKIMSIWDVIVVMILLLN